MKMDKDMLKMTESLVNIAAEAWRFKRTFSKMVTKMDPFETDRYLHQYNWFQRKVDQALADAGIVCQDLTGHRYDVGMAVQAMNLDEFEDQDILYIGQMIEPVIIANGRVMRTGTAMLVKQEQE